MMSAPWKGMLLGTCTVLVTTAAIVGFELASAGVWVDRQTHAYELRELFMMMCFGGILPALATGAALGKLAEHLVMFRRTILVGLGLAAVVVFGILTTTQAIKQFCLPAIVATLVLAHWTRRDADGEPRPDGPLTATWKGAYVGIANVVAIAVLVGVTIALHPTRHNLELFGFGFLTTPSDVMLPLTLMIAFMGFIPGLVMGAVVGWLAGRFAQYGRGTRVAVLASAALAMGGAAAGTLGTPQAAVLASVPTLIAAFVLEAWTRRNADVMPIARVVQPRTR